MHSQGNIPIDESEVIELDVPLLLYIFRQHRILICCLMILCLSLGVALTFLFHKEKYVSQSTIVLNPAALSSLAASQRAGDNIFRALGPNSDPFKNQEALLKSRLLAERVYHQLKREQFKLKSPKQLASNVLSAEHVRGTDFITLTVTWDKPHEAKVIAEAYMAVYQSLSDELNSAPLTEQKETLEKQVAAAEEELQNINDKIQTYEESNNIVDIDTESDLLLTGYDELRTDMEKIQASVAEKKAEIANLQKQLHLDTQTAIDSVATGQNNLYSNLVDKLNQAEQDYNVKALTYSPTNPDMVKLKEQIAVLEKQLTDQRIYTIGRKIKQENSTIIMDDVRKEMVKRLALQEAEYVALKNRWEVNRQQLGSMQSDLNKVPSKQITHARLILERKSKEDILSRLKDKLADAKVQNASNMKKIYVVDAPSLPGMPMFPNKLHLLALSVALSLVVPSGTVVAFQYLNSQLVRPRFLEKFCNVPVLTVIPWFSKKRWSKYRHAPEVLLKNEAIENAYQTLVLNLKIQCNQQEKHVLAIGSTHTSVVRDSFIICNLARFLAQSGHRVLLVDANLRDASLSHYLENEDKPQTGLANLVSSLNSLGISSLEHPDVREELLKLIQLHIAPTQVHGHIDLLQAGHTENSIFEILNSKGMETAIRLLKEQYDWILFDVPALLKSSDPYSVLKYVDGLLLMVEGDATKQQVELVCSKVRQIQSKMIGAVLRDFMHEDAESSEFFSH